MTNILIKNVTIVTMQDDNKLIKNGYLAITKDKISYLGEDLPKDFLPQVIIDGTNKLLMPGIINTHTHTPMVLLRSYADNIPLQEWLFNKVFPKEAELSAEDVYWASKLAILEMIKSGTTCFADMYFYMDEIAKAVEETGLRANLSRGLQCFNNKVDITKDIRLIENKKLYEDWNGKANGRIKIGVGPHSIYTCTPEYIKHAINLAKKLNTNLHIHISETSKENEDCKRLYNKTPTEHLHDLGFFECPTLAAHCVHVSDNDIKIFKENNVNIAYNPGSNLKLGSGIADIDKFLKNDINISLGTDGASSNNNLNMFEEMHLAGLISKGVKEDSTIIKAYDVLKMATVNSAKALRIDNKVGLLKPGMKADMIMLDIDQPHYYPMHDAIANLVYSAQAADVETVIVDGEILMYKGEIKTIDSSEVYFNINKIYKKLFT